MTVSLEGDAEKFIRIKVAAGGFKSPEEVVRAGLLILKERDQAIAEKIEVGWAQARAGNLLNPDEVRQTLAKFKTDFLTQRQSPPDAGS